MPRCERSCGTPAHTEHNLLVDDGAPADGYGRRARRRVRSPRVSLRCLRAALHLRWTARRGTRTLLAAVRLARDDIKLRARRYEQSTSVEASA